MCAALTPRPVAPLSIPAERREVSETLGQLSEPHELERRIEDGLISLDIALTDRMVAVEVDG